MQSNQQASQSSNSTAVNSTSREPTTKNYVRPNWGEEVQTNYNVTRNSPSWNPRESLKDISEYSESTEQETRYEEPRYEEPRYEKPANSLHNNGNTVPR